MISGVNLFNAVMIIFGEFPSSETDWETLQMSVQQQKCRTVKWKGFYSVRLCATTYYVHYITWTVT